MTRTPQFAACLGAGVLLAGCGATTIITTTAPPPASSSSPAAHAARRLAVGGSATLVGNAGEKMRVTVLGVQDPATFESFNPPTSGTRYVVVQVALANVGTVAYSDSPSNSATLLSTTGEQATRTIDTAACGGAFFSDAKIAPGGSETGCLPFEMADGQQPGKFQFTLSSGFADQTAEWSLAGSRSAPIPQPSAPSPAPAVTVTDTTPSPPAPPVRTYSLNLPTDPNTSSTDTTTDAVPGTDTTPTDTVPIAPDGSGGTPGN